MARIPAADWPVDEAGPTLDALLAYARTIPTADRTSPAALDVLRLADALAGLLPADRAASKARRELGDLGVRVIRLGTVTDQMLFDKDRIAAQAGKPVEVVFENGDIMPHNFVVTKPGALETVGLLGESTGTEPGALEPRLRPPLGPDPRRQPPARPPRVAEDQLHRADASRGSILTSAPIPATGGGCTARSTSSRTSPPISPTRPATSPSHPLPILDDLLKDNRPRKEWTYDDLASGVEALDHGRSFANARQIFEVASCVSCHRMNGVGEQVGPDLARLDPKMTRGEILRSLLEPSAKVDEKYQTHNSP